MKASQPKEKKYLTIMFVDIIDSTQLFENYDSEDVSDFLQRFLDEARQIVHSHNGIINQTAGDGFYAVFGFDEDTIDKQAFLACCCANEIQSKIKRFRLRIGINCGYATYVNDSEFPDLKHHLVGKPVNTAAHICNQIKLPETWISESIYRQVKGFFSTSQAPVKKSKFENCYILHDSIDQKNKFSLQNYNENFIGREDDLKVGLKLIKKSFEVSSQHIHISGVSGIGKTSFVFKLLEKYKNKDTYIFSYGFLPEHAPDQISLDIFLEQIFKHFSISFSQTQDAVNFLEQNSLYKTPYLSFLCAFFNLNWEDSDWKNIENSQKAYIQSEFISDLISIYSQQYKIFVVFDDIQWAGQQSQTLLKALNNKKSQGKYALISISYKTCLEHEINSSHEFFLGPLNLLQIESVMISETNFDVIPKELAKKINKITKGNPYYVIQASKYIKSQFEDPFEIEECANILPDTINTVFLNKLKQLSVKEQYVLKTAAIIGQIFKLEDLKAILFKYENSLYDCLQNLEEKKLIHRLSIFEDIFEFAHALERESIHSGLSKSFRTQKHKYYLSFLEKRKEKYIKSKNAYSQLTYHSFEAGMYDKAYVYGFHAGQRAIALSMPQDAVLHYDKSINSLKRMDFAKEKNKFRLLRALLLATKAYSLNGNVNFAEKHFIEAKQLNLKQKDSQYKNFVKGLLLETEILLRWLLLDYSPKKIEFFEKEISILKIQKPKVSYVRLASMLADLGYYKKSNEKLLKILGNVQLEENNGLLFPSYAATMSEISRNYGELGQYFLAKEYAKTAMSYIDDCKFSPSKIYTLALSASHLIKLQEYSKAFTILDEAYTLANHFDIGNIGAFVLAQHVYSKYFLEKNFEDAENNFMYLISSMTKKRMFIKLPIYYYYYADICFNEKQFEKSLSICKQGIKLAKMHNDLSSQAYLSYLIFLNGKKHDSYNYYIKSTEIAEKLDLDPLLKKLNKANPAFQTIH